MIISATDGLAVGPHVRIAFLSDYGIYERLLVAVPVLLLGEKDHQSLLLRAAR